MKKHKQILNYLQTVESATLEHIYNNMPFSYYCNGHKHLGNILSTMVRQGKINRIKKGVFEVNKNHFFTKKLEDVTEIPNQLKLL